MIENRGKKEKRHWYSSFGYYLLVLVPVSTQIAKHYVFRLLCHAVYRELLKTGSLDNGIREFSLAKPSWYMSHYTTIFQKGERMHDFLGLFVFIVV